MIKLFERNIKEAKRRSFQEEMFEEYRELVEKLCPMDFEVKVYSDYDCQFTYIPSIDHGGNTAYGFLMDRDISRIICTEEQLKKQIDWFCRVCRAEWSGAE